MARDLVVPANEGDAVTLEQLMELDRKATQGEWSISIQPSYNSVFAVGQGQHGHSLTICHANASQRNLRDHEFIAALVNFWRAGGREMVRDGLRYREPMKVWEQCEKHRGLPIWIAAGSHTSALKVCPDCEREAARRTSGDER